MFKKIALTVASLAFVFAMPVAVLAQTDTTTSTYDTTSYDSTYDTSTLTDQQAAAVTGTAMVFSIIMIIVSSIFGLAAYIYTGLTLSTIAKKIGQANAWFAWVPILNLVLMANIADINPAMLLIILIPIVGEFYAIYFVIVAYMKMSEKRGLDKYLGLLMLIPVVSFIFMGYLAWAKITPKQATVVPATPVQG